MTPEEYRKALREEFNNRDYRRVEVQGDTPEERMAARRKLLGITVEPDLSDQLLTNIKDNNNE